jgi:UPF0755 protein
MIRHLRLIAVVLSVLLLAGATIWWRYAIAPLPLSQPRLDLEIERGQIGPALLASLARQGITVPAWQYSLAMRWRGDAQRIRAGNFEVQAPLSLKGLLDRLTRGDMRFREVALIEGWTFKQVRDALNRQSELRHDAAALNDQDLLQALGATETHPEGLFAPDTYAYSRGTSDLDVLRRAYRLQQQRLTAAWQARPTTEATPRLASPYEALVLASIIEKETGRESDRTKVAAVFANRLRQGMRLQSDPTTIYGLGDRFDGNLRRSDLRADTPWNTYTRKGLPPTPIAMPGKASLQAALNPEASTALYFVARGDGSSEFSDDLAAHNRAVARFQKKSP